MHVNHLKIALLAAAIVNISEVSAAASSAESHSNDCPKMSVIKSDNQFMKDLKAHKVAKHGDKTYVIDENCAETGMPSHSCGTLITHEKLASFTDKFHTSNSSKNPKTNRCVYNLAKDVPAGAETHAILGVKTSTNSLGTLVLKVK